MPTDAHGTDPAENKVGILLFVDDGYLSEVRSTASVATTSRACPFPKR
jgi:hypothetical protein